MEVKSEKTDTVAKFWELFNEALQKYTGIEGYKFNPKGWMVDEAGRNFKGLKKVYGEEIALHRIISCQWHFLHQAQKKLKLQETMKKNSLIHVPTYATLQPFHSMSYYLHV